MERFLGAGILATGAAEMLNELMLAMSVDAGLTKVSSLPHVYPSWGYGLQRTADQWLMDLSKRWYVEFGLDVLRKFS